jgi:hypothetical protein
MSGRITADQTLRRLSSALREGFEMRKDLLKTLGNRSSVDVPGEVAGYAATQWLPAGLVGKGMLGGGAYVLKGMNPKLWPILAASSPRIMGEFLSAYGTAMKAVQPATSAMGKLAKGLSNEKIVNPAFMLNELTKKRQEQTGR